MSQESELDYLPATQQSGGGDDPVAQRSTFLWTRDSRQRGHDSPSCSGSAADAHFVHDDALRMDESYDFATSIHAAAPLENALTPPLEETLVSDNSRHTTPADHEGDSPSSKAIEAVSAVEQEKTERRVKRANDQQPVTSWKVARFASRSQPARRGLYTFRPTESEDEDVDDDDIQPIKPPPSTGLTGRSWRIPLSARAEQAALFHSLDDRTDAQEVDAQLALLDECDEDRLPHLASTDESDTEGGDRESIDYAELEDFLRYRLPSGLHELDRRLGLEAQHAALLDGSQSLGLCSGGILEIAGTPGSGKTTFLIQLALQERIHALLQAATSISSGDAIAQEEGETYAARQVVFIDTEGSVSIERLHGMASSLLSQHLAEDRKLVNPPDLDILLEHTLAGIFLVRCTQMADLLATFETLMPSADFPIPMGADEKQAAERVMKAWEDKRMPPNTSLVVIDSISHLFRSSVSDDAAARRTRQHAFACIRTFCSNVHSWGIKLVVSNQMSSVFVTSEGRRTHMTDRRGAAAYLRPAMREWLDEKTAKDAWQTVLYFADPVLEHRRAKLTGRPESLNELDYLDEGFWSTPIPFQIDGQGIVQTSR